MVMSKDLTYVTVKRPSMAVIAKIGLLVLGFRCLAIGSSAYAQTEGACEPVHSERSENGSRFDFHFSGRHITILGWLHTDSNLQNRARMARQLDRARRAAASGDCEAARKNLVELTTDQLTSYKSAVELMRQLRIVHRAYDVQSLGTEFSPETGLKRRHAAEDEARRLLDIMDLCPAQTGDVVKKVALLFPGPEYLFQKTAVPAVEARPLENEGVRRRALQLSREISQLPRLDTEALPTERLRSRFLRVLEKVQDGIFISRGEIDEILNDRLLGKLKILTSEYLNRYEKLSALNPIRNQYMVENIFAHSENYAVVVGISHAKDLQEMVREMCLLKIRGQMHTAARNGTTSTAVPDVVR
jgi:hypothetical protein